MQEIIRAENLKKTYGQTLAVDQVSFSVEKGSLFAFLGPNGAGKTTTIKMLLGLTQPDEGRIFFFQKEQSGKEISVRRELGIIFQEITLDDYLTAAENLKLHGLAFGLRGRELTLKIEQLLTFVQLSEKAKTPVKKFSTGMKRRLEIARALLHQPSVLFLDEPTVGLDPQTRNRFWELIRLKKQEGLTVFLTTHYLEEAEAADQVVILDHGRVIACGAPGELKSQYGLTSLNDLFLQLTGTDLRDEDANVLRQFLEREGRRFR